MSKEKTKEAHYHNAITLFGKDDFEGSLKEHLAALEIDPRYADALQGAAAVYEKQGHLDQAAACHLKIIRIEPDNLFSYTSLSILFQKLEMPRSAEEMGNTARILSWKEEAQSKKDSSGDIKSGEEENPFKILE